ncbi:DUF5049 domain-containing protein [Effusibacillus consociatus]|uniref:DUF5049 domain-containing protein n=1 Tax=Effusibacillus consociatus TaxID=1117041 RepID=A0ABV9PZV2_9BACL
MVQVSQKVFDGLEAVRSSGVTNMLDYGAVMYYAAKWGYTETVLWMQDHKRDYIQGIFEGFEIVSS